MSPTSENRRAEVSSRFHRARRQAAVESILARLSGQPIDLLSFDEVAHKLGVVGQSSLGVKQIPIDAIIGSVGRCQDFTRTFLPRRESDEERWVSVGAAARSVADLPPIVVYKLGDSYFVQDGNHRVSLARQQNLHFIDAYVTEVRTRAPMPPGSQPDGLIIAAELAAFLVYTRLDVSRPGSDFQVSVPGQYRHLESHIEAYRYVREAGEDRELTFEEAARDWYDEAYMPLIKAIREQAILRYFPGRTETDFFVWLTRHRVELQRELGYSIAPDVAVSRLLGKVSEASGTPRPALVSRLRRLAKLAPPKSTATPPLRTWAQERTLDRYSEHLFGSFLLPIRIDEARGLLGPKQDALEWVLTIAGTEQAHFCALCILDHLLPTNAESAAIDDLRARLRAASFPTELLSGSGDPVEWSVKVGYFNDLIILERDFFGNPDETASLSAVDRAIIQSLHRPFLLLGNEAGKGLPNRVLLIHDTIRALDEAIFIAVYLAEQWGIELTILPISNDPNSARLAENIGQYLALHEVVATFLDPIGPNDLAVETIDNLNNSGVFDLMIITGPDRGQKSNRANQQTELLWSILSRWTRPALIAT